MSLTVNVDCDGVLYDFTTEAVKLAKRKGLEPDAPNQWNMGIPDFGAHFPGFIKQGIFLTGDPIEGGYDALAYLTRAGVRVRLVTHKVFDDPALTTIAVTDATDWLMRHGFLDLNIEMAFTNSHGKQGYEADVVIDDKPTLDWAQPCALNILFDQPWNRHVTSAMTQKGVIRARSWPQIVRLIEGHITVV